MKILNTIANFSPEAKLILESIGTVTYLVPTQKELAGILAEYDAAIVGLGLRFDREVLLAAKKLKVIATATTGLDHLDLAVAKKQGIEVLSLRGEDEFLNSITGTAELALALLLNLMRLIIPAAEAVKRGEWERERFRGHSLAGKTLGVVGVGRLGRMMIRYGRAFGMQVSGYDPKVTVAAFGAESVSLEQLASASDVISLHLHLAPETENLIDRKIFNLMKSSAVLVNTSRGKIVNELDLLAALKSRQIAGYAADVLADEAEFNHTTVAKHSLIEYAKTHDNCLIVPHIGGMTFESRAATDVFIARKLVLYCSND
jgi:D-3-phosphoglycerate dehydrogenase